MYLLLQLMLVFLRYR